MSTGKLTIERIYVITNLPPGAATGTQLATWIRGHWHIENQFHHARDRTFREDDSKIRAGQLPRTMASLRNLAIASTAKTATPTSPPLSATPLATTAAPRAASVSPDESGQDHFAQ